jgi:ABC-type multidrug transport system ATPase subunit
MNADVIFVVANGEIVEQGSHENLLEKKGKYSELWSKQIFVKPKDVKEPSVPGQEEDAAKQQEDSQSSNASTVGSGDEEIPTAATIVPATKLNRQVSTPRLITTTVAETATDPSSKTPNGHTKEVDQSKDRS